MTSPLPQYLRELEAQSIYIIREAYARAHAPVVLYSIGKDSSVLMRLVEKAFSPAAVPMPLLHIDTSFKFKEMIVFRDAIAKERGWKLIVRKNEEDEARALRADDAATDRYIYLKKTKPLIEAIRTHGFDVIVGGARREEEKSRAKERIFSIRNEFGVWDPRRQRVEFGNLYNTELAKGETLRVFPLADWTEIDVWRYIAYENIPVVDLYFARERSVVERSGTLIEINELVTPHLEERVQKMKSRYRTLGCAPSTGAFPSQAVTIHEIILELTETTYSERGSRLIDHGSHAAMEQKKREGYF